VEGMPRERVRETKIFLSWRKLARGSLTTAQNR
jgi:hypothetical protein